MLVYVFTPDLLIRFRDMHEPVATTIAEVAGVPRSQVGIVLTAKHRALLSIDFWVASEDSTLSKAAVRRVNTKWTNSDFKLMWNRMYSWVPAFMVSGGIVSGGVERYKCEN